MKQRRLPLIQLSYWFGSEKLLENVGDKKEMVIQQKHHTTKVAILQEIQMEMWMGIDLY